MTELVEIALDESTLVGRERAVLQAGACSALVRRQHRAPWLRTAPCRCAWSAAGRRRWALALVTGDVDALARRGTALTAVAAARTASTLAASALSRGGTATLTLPDTRSLALPLAGALSLALPLAFPLALAGPLPLALAMAPARSLPLALSCLGGAAASCACRALARLAPAGTPGLASRRAAGCTVREARDVVARVIDRSVGCVARGLLPRARRIGGGLPARRGQRRLRTGRVLLRQRGRRILQSLAQRRIARGGVRCCLHGARHVRALRGGHVGQPGGEIAHCRGDGCRIALAQRLAERTRGGGA